MYRKCLSKAIFNVVDTLQSVSTHITEVQCPTTVADIITCLHEPNPNPNPKTIVVDMGPWDKQGWLGFTDQQWLFIEK